MKKTNFYDPNKVYSSATTFSFYDDKEEIKKKNEIRKKKLKSLL